VPPLFYRLAWLERKGNGKNKVIKEMGVVVGRLVWIVFGLVGLVVETTRDENVILSGVVAWGLQGN